MTNLTVIILTFNEELHIERCIRSLEGLAHQIFVVDSFSTDRTVELAKSMGAITTQRTFLNHADQFQWAMDNFAECCGQRTEWVMRLDADEYVTPQLKGEIIQRVTTAPEDVRGYTIKRCVYFEGRPIRHGGAYQQVLRLWREGYAKIEATWMDEHIVLLDGKVGALDSEIHDNNRNYVTWWTDKHNRYASREAIELLEKKALFRFVWVTTPGGWASASGVG